MTQRTAARRTEAARLKRAAYHEAGHVAAAYHYGRGIHALYVRMTGQVEIVDRRGQRAERADGLTQIVDNFNHHLCAMSLSAFLDLFQGSATDREQLRHRIIDGALRDTIFSYTGCAAEARLRRVSGFQAWLEGGRGDHERVKYIIGWIEPDKAHADVLHGWCDTLACKLVREPAVWSQIEQVAEALLRTRKGVLTSDHRVFAIFGKQSRRPLPLLPLPREEQERKIG